MGTEAGFDNQGQDSVAERKEILESIIGVPDPSSAICWWFWMDYLTFLSFLSSAVKTELLMGSLNGVWLCLLAGDGECLGNFAKGETVSRSSHCTCPLSRIDLP